MSDIYAIGMSGLRAYQGALATVSENIANAQTPGYAKRIATLKEFSATSGGVAGGGAYVAGIQRSADAFRAADVRRAGADLARTDTGVAWLERIETTLSAGAVGDRLTAFFNAATTLAADPSATTPRAQMLQAADSAAYAFASTGRELTAMTTELNASADQGVATLNGLGATLAKINEGLQRTQPNTAAAALLGDQRDQVLEQMSAIVDTNVTLDDFGRATVRLAGPAGPTFVAPDGAGAGTVGYARNDAGAFAFTVSRGATIANVAAGGGMLAGIADSAQRIADARTTLGGLATDFAAAANTFQGNGRDLDGVAGAALFAQDPADPTQLTLTLTDPRQLAVAGPGGGPRDNANLLALAAVRTTARLEGRAITLVGQNATALSAARTVAAAQGSIREGAVARYDATTGVDLDNEAVELMRFQQAYQGCARAIQVGRECFTSLLDAV